MTEAQIWWKILRVYTENIKFNFGLEIYCTGRTFHSIPFYLFACSRFITKGNDCESNSNEELHFYGIGLVCTTAVVSLNIPESVLFADFVKRLKNDTCFHGYE